VVAVGHDKEQSPPREGGQGPRSPPKYQGQLMHALELEATVKAELMEVIGRCHEGLVPLIEEPGPVRTPVPRDSESGWAGLNRRPFGPEPNALPTALQPA
jgi:hypothetical protein